MTSYQGRTFTEDKMKFSLKEKGRRLWNAATAYQEAEIQGAAIGLLTIGVLQGKPKCVAVQNWIKAVWSLYYARKAQLSEATDPDLNFSSCGPMPYSVPELMAEVGV